MHNVNRQKLNRRFIEVYRKLEKREEIVKNDRQRSKSAFARKLGTKGHIIDKFLREERLITYEQAKKLCRHYGVSELFLFQGEGPVFSRKPLPDSEDKLAMVLGIDFSPNILFTNIEAFASNTVGVDLIEENQRFHIPGIKGDLIAFYINGDSMSPTLSPGDMVICQPLDNFREMEEGEIYAVVSKQSVWVKRLHRCRDPLGKWTHLKLVSDNSEEFAPFYLELPEIRRILKVKKRLTGLE